MRKLNFLTTCHAKWHYFDVAKSLNKKGQLVKLVTGYPNFKSKKYNIPSEKIDTFPLYVMFDYILRGSQNNFLNKIRDKLQYANAKRISKNAIKYFENSDVMLSISGSGYWSLDKFKEMGKIFICERSSSHINYQKSILEDEYKSYKLKNILDLEFSNWKIENEIYEYENADFILTPSKFVTDSFISKGHKNIIEVRFGVNTDDFKVIENKKTKNTFDILFVGQLSLRKGLHYLLEAFDKFSHPNKRLHIAGPKILDYEFFLDRIKGNDKIIFHGKTNKAELIKLYNLADVFVLPTLEDGYSIVINEAMACGCPVIVTTNSGAEEYVNESKCGMVVPIRNSDKIVENLEILASDKNMLGELSYNASKIDSRKSWDDYTEELNNKIIFSKK